MEPVHDAICFAGEAVHETLWGTVGGAWESGERAADAVLHRLGGQQEPVPVDAETAARIQASPRFSAGAAAEIQAQPRIMRDGY